MNDLIGYTLLIFLGNENFLVVLATFVVALSVFMTLVESWRFTRKED